ncbi:MAG: Panacea domain-containing protein [Dehalococcoidales bacterium]
MEEIINDLGEEEMVTIEKRIQEDHIAFDKEKFVELWLYIASESEGDERFGATKLNKIFQYSDFEAYRELGKPITGADYKHIQEGAAPNQLLLVKQEIEGKDIDVVENKYYTQAQKRTVARRKPDLSRFTREELDIVDRVIERLWLFDAMGVSKLSQGEFGYKLTQKDELIPYAFAYFLATPLSEEQIQLGTQVAERHGLK